ncbi:unnamed protein product [Bursaphelenchus okinawaensis]|uniref:EB domain-containing protein n=1 Tax=Bursaphelenchus okinawaensis TaxID=465554 RepID=A0A811KUQ1_9BILA|nr:unnamed protein product [Bursaphelenchus okinawaensis]CAG9111081.1 unnamed protein product [Bursaphelenchus okinawaensis]
MTICIKRKITVFVLLQYATVLVAQYTPCNGKSPLGETCDRDEDCDNKGSICLRNKCQCHPYYEARTSKDYPRGKCVRLPSRIGEECTTKCREPLFCRNGRCQCVQRGSTSVQNGVCVTVTKVGDRCSRHYDCSSPFSACVNQQCTCIAGTVQQGTRCVAPTNCPLGGQPQGSCTRRVPLSAIPNFVPESDTCPSGYYCVTTPESHSGHCCPQKCPLGTAVDTQYTCVPGGVEKILGNLTLTQKQCPSDTHYCHYLAGDSFAQAVCCKRPCNSMAPEALYLNGECVARGQLNSACQIHEQCGAAEGMECKDGQCTCSDGFKPHLDAITNPIHNPSQTCSRECEKDMLSRDTACFAKTQLGGQCFVQEQCPPNSGCYRGRCMCRCGYKQASNNKCVELPPPTTQTPPQVIPQVPGLPTGKNLFSLFNDFLNGGGAGMAG